MWTKNKKLVFEYENIRHLQNGLSKIVAELYIFLKKDHPENIEISSKEDQNIECK